MDLISIKSLPLFLFIFSCFINLSLALPCEFLIPHNEAQAEVGVEPLTWDESLATYARWYASERVEYCKLQHSEGPFGENIAVGYGDQFNASEAVKLWVGEKDNYKYESNSCVGDQCLHYTQVVWRNSVHLGCAEVKCNNGWRFITCNYDPPGNYVGERPY